MTTTITYHGISTYEVSGPNGRVVFDPFFDGNPAAVVGADDLETPDVIVASHAAIDHMGDAARLALRTGATVVCGTDTAALLRQDGVPDSQLRLTTWGIRVRFGDIVVRPVPCAHWSQAKMNDGQVISGVPMAFVVEFEPGVRVYHFGDSAITSEMSLIGKLHQPTVGLLGCSQPWSLVAPGGGTVVTGEMNPDEAAYAAELLGVRYAVGTHYESPEDPAVQEFLRAVPIHDSTGVRVPLALTPGQQLVIDGDNYEVRDR
jgi:L-ascorbate metabolism protein UlaG (beta-lactamase superfamily)